MDDVRAVLEAVGSERAALFGHSEGGNMCVLFAATYPERTAALITLGCFAKRRDPDDDYPWAPTAENRGGDRGGRRAELGPLAAAGRRVLRPEPRRGRAVHAESRAVPAAFREPRRGRRPRADELAHRRPGDPAGDPRADARPPPHGRPRRERRRRAGISQRGSPARSSSSSPASTTGSRPATRTRSSTRSRSS